MAGGSSDRRILRKRKEEDKLGRRSNRMCWEENRIKVEQR